MSTNDGKSSSKKPKSLNELFAHSHVFLTGATGFIGTALLQRMLTLEPGPAKVYVLVRSKYNTDAQKRLNDVLSAEVFATLPKSKLENVQAVVGDCGLKGLGISKEDREMLESKCNLVFHAAGYISFAASYETTIRLNTLSTQSVLELAKNMPKLKAFVHVSTSYVSIASSNKDCIIEEKIYPTTLDPMEYTDLVDKLSPDEFNNRIVRTIGDKFGNSYPLSKILAENLLDKKRENLPIAIVRPCNVLSAWREPIPGWYGNFKNATLGFVIGISYGAFRSFSLEGEETMIQILPVDLVVSTILAAALATVQDPSQLHVYNCTTNSTNPISIRDYFEYSVIASRKHPADTMMLYPCINLQGSFFRHKLRCWIFQLLPCYALVFFESFLGESSNKPYQITAKKLLWYQWKFYKGCMYTSAFMSERYRFDRRKTDKLVEILPPEEQEKHPMDPRQLNWMNYFEVCVLGSRKFGGSITKQVRRKDIIRLKLLKLLWLTSPLIGMTLIYLFLTFCGVTSQISILISLCIIGFLVWI